MFPGNISFGKKIEEASDLKLVRCSALLLPPYNPWEPLAFSRNPKENDWAPMTLHEAGLSWRYFSVRELFESTLLIGKRERSDKIKKLYIHSVYKAHVLLCVEQCCIPRFIMLWQFLAMEHSFMDRQGITLFPRTLLFWVVQYVFPF